MAEENTVSSPIVRIGVRLKVGDSLMAATDDPLFLELLGGNGREFRLALNRGKSLRRGQEEHYVLGDPEDAETNLANPELNDPTAPPIDARGITGVRIRKGQEPVPNVRAFGEMDDRLELTEVEVVIHTDNGAAPLRFARSGSVWLGLICGQSIQIGRFAATT